MSRMFENARNELFSQIHRCGVLNATPEHQADWLNDTMDYLGEQYPSLSEKDLQELFQIGSRFCQPVIPHGHSSSEAAAETTA